MKKPLSSALLPALVATAFACSSGRDESPRTASAQADGGASTFADAGGFATCVTARTEAKLQPVNLVFMFDQSGSMGDEAHGAIFGFTKAARWNPITNGMKRFFADAASSGIRASLQYFPLDKDWCEAKSYKTPEVPLTALPNPGPFITSFNAHQPLGGTPTLPAVTGAIDYAKELKAQFPSEESAVVLVTDGSPSDCGSFDEVVDRLKAEAANVKTYVVGVGADLTFLADMAKAGGTGQAIMVDLANPQQTSDEFVKALGAIRGKAVSCRMPLPKAPDGKALSPKEVNVALASSSSVGGAPPEILSYDATCADPNGWRYDDINAPTTIELCAASCERVRSIAGGAVDVQLGCVTKGLVK